MEKNLNRSKKRIYTILLFIIFVNFSLLSSFAQKEANTWYFGDSAALDFNSGVPIAMGNSAMDALEGCSSIADTSGNLLFYTDGRSVWTKNHTAMPNGTGLNGKLSSTQAALIVQKPLSSNIYYVFTTRGAATSYTPMIGLNYSVVDMNANSGLGDVINKNIPLNNNAYVSEKVTGVKHANGVDIWVVGHLWDNDKFTSFLVTPNGIDTTPIVSATGISHSGGYYAGNSNCIGYMKLSPLGNKIGLALRDSCFQVLDFDNSTGRITNPITIDNYSYAGGMYGCEFSSDGSKIYFTQGGSGSVGYFVTIYQYDLSMFSETDILNSKTEIGVLHSCDLNRGSWSALQLATDGKIYITQYGCDSLSVIDNPNSLGLSCNLNINGVALAPNTSCDYGLPNMVQSYFLKETFGHRLSCNRDTIHFQMNDTAGINAVEWKVLDSANNIFANSSDYAPTFELAPNLYKVELTTYINSDTLYYSSLVEIKSVEMEVPRDTTICNGSEITLTPTFRNDNDAYTYSWYDGSTNDSIVVSTTGQYSFTVTNSQCLYMDTINVIFDSIPNISLGNDTTICEGQFVNLMGGIATSYLWSTNDTTSMINVSTPDSYWLNASNGLCSISDTIDISQIRNPIINFGNDTSICEDQSIDLAGGLASSYLWSNNSTARSITVSTSGSYWLKAANGPCFTIDTINVFQFNYPIVNLGNDTTICEGQSIMIDGGVAASYLWSDDNIVSFINITNSGLYWLKASNGNCSQYDSIYVSSCEIGVKMPSVFTPNGDNLNNLFIPIAAKGIVSMNTVIYNRWGNKVYDTNNPLVEWDGGNETEGTYFWIANYTDLDGNKLTNKGYLTLVR